MSYRISLGFPKNREKYSDLPVIDSRGKSISEIIEDCPVYEDVIESVDVTAIDEGFAEDSNAVEAIDDKLIEIDRKIKELSEKIMKLECISRALSENEDK